MGCQVIPHVLRLLDRHPAPSHQSCPSPIGLGASAMTGPGDFPIIGVGASAGGVEALKGLLRGMPSKPGLALVVITHLSPDHESLLHEILAHQTELPVHVAVDGMAVESGRIY